MIGIIFDVVFVGFIASLFVNIVLSVKLFDVTKYNKMLVESAKDGYSAGFEVARAFYKEAVRTLRDNARLGADMSDYIVRSVDLHALEVVSQLEAEKESHDIPRR